MRFVNIASLAIAWGIVGCGGSAGPPAAIGPLPALSVEEWKALPIEEKYDEATFDRLKQKDPNLQSDRGWDRFMRAVVVPERKQDIPGVPGQ